MKAEKHEQQQQQPSLLTWAKHSILLLTTIVVVIAAFGNSLTWHMQRFWGASGNFWQSLWDRFLFYVGDDEFTLIVIGTNLWSMLYYWTLGSIYMFMDITGLPKFVRKYKVQPGVNEPIDTKKLFPALRQVLFNQMVGLALAIVGYPLTKLRGIPAVHVLPTFQEVLFQLMVLIIVEEIGFYYAHRMFHHRFFYKRIHKKHHEWTAPCALIATYCHPLEHVVANLLPPIVGIMITNAHVATSWLWFTIVISITLNDHSGYHLPFLPSPELHDFHHLKFNQCYGSLGILDYLHGTDTLFRSSPEFKRHLVSRTLEPVRKLFPDSLKQKGE
jgi:methylsterol monooxygenase